MAPRSDRARRPAPMAGRPPGRRRTEARPRRRPPSPATPIRRWTLASSRGGDARPGTRAEPLATASRALDAAQQLGRRWVFLCASELTENVVIRTVHFGVRVYGGLACPDEPAPWTTVAGRRARMTQHAETAPNVPAWRVEAIGLPVVQPARHRGRCGGRELVTLRRWAADSAAGRLFATSRASPTGFTRRKHAERAASALRALAPPGLGPSDGAFVGGALHRPP